MKRRGLLCLFIFVAITSTAQMGRAVQEQCATMIRLSSKFERNPGLKAKFENQRQQFRKAVREGQYRLPGRSARGEGDENRTVTTIPVVFHIVSKNPHSITDAQIQAQLDTLNKDFFGSNGDSVKIPAYFKPLFGKSGIQFCLAQRTPGGENTTGIERITTTQTSFSSNDNIKYTSSGGANVWDSDKYLNVWVGALSSNLLGYATFPEDGIPSEQGVVIDYRTLPGGSYEDYNTGKTLTHETGHFFNLYHIWGDDKGACTGSDDVDDTPNQANSSTRCYSGIRTDNCTTGGNGIMYQNYMDYSTDDCMVMFTSQQVSRMESALLAYRASLLTSNGCEPPIVLSFDADLRSINQPAQRLCVNTFTPVITIRNQGSQTLTSLVIKIRVDNGSITELNWKGNLIKLASTEITLNSLTAAVGVHTLTISISNPNNNTDEDVSNDSRTITFQYYNPVASVTESFERTTHPPEGWDIVNPDNSVTWQRVTGNSKTGNASIMMNNNGYNAVGQKDDIRLPTLALAGVDSAFLSFQVAAAAYTDISAQGNVWDTLEVLASTDCGVTYTSLYKKYGSSLVTRTTSTPNEFRPAGNEWRKDSINLANYIGRNTLLLAFRNTNGYENNIFLDDINVRTVTINPNLKRQGFLVTPNPVSSLMTVQFYPQPSNLKAIQLINLTGQKMLEVITNGQANNIYNFNLSNYPAGMYVVRAVFTDKVLAKKIIKQ